jgi:hypothetical protein
MQHPPFTWTSQYVFKPVLLGYLLRLFAVFILGASLLGVYARSRNTGWLFAVGVCVIVASIVVWHYHAQKVVIHDADIIVHRWLRDAIVVSIALDDIEPRQGLVGRMFDVGTLYIQLNGKDVKLASIGTLSAFSSIVAERRDVIRQLLVTYHQRLEAEERDIRQFLGHMRPQRASEALAR